MPVTIILHLQDDEYPSRVTRFFDPTADFRLSLSDIVWSAAMLSTLVMFDRTGKAQKTKKGGPRQGRLFR